MRRGVPPPKAKSRGKSRSKSMKKTATAAIKGADVAGSSSKMAPSEKKDPAPVVYSEEATKLLRDVKEMMDEMRPHLKEAEK